jgi:hypothetical protein
LPKCPKIFSLNTAKYGEVYNMNKQDYGKNQYEDNITVKHGKATVPVIGAEFSARNKEEKSMKRKTMDINYAHYMMGHMGETALKPCEIITISRQQVYFTIVRVVSGGKLKISQ